MSGNTDPDELAAFRRDLLTCNKCFEATPESGCRHHEDLLGGYLPKGRIVFLGVNPQGSDTDPVYQHIEASSWEKKAALSDELLAHFAGGPQPSTFDAWIYRDHDGLRKWLPRVRKLLGVDLEELGSHFAFVEAYKHTTANERVLRKLPQWNNIRKHCPSTWLLKQIKWLAPRLVVFSGNSGRRIATDLFFRGAPSNPLATPRLREVHGHPFEICVDGTSVPALMTLAISRRTTSLWKDHAKGTANIRRLLRNHIDSASPRRE